MSDLGVGEEVPDGELSHPAVGRGSCPSPLHPISESRLSRDPYFHRGDLSPALSLPAVASLSLGLSLLLPKGRRLPADGEIPGLAIL